MNELRMSVGAGGDRMACASAAMEYAERAGADRRSVGEIGLCVAELVSNVERYADAGTLVVRVADGEAGYLEIIVEDRGPGIANLEAARQDGWSMGRRRELGEPVCARSLGLGLGTVVRLMDGVDFESQPGRGTRVMARKRIHRASR